MKLHLSHVADNHGQEAMQSEWRRIWTAFVTFQRYGDLDAVFKRIWVVSDLSLTVPNFVHDKCIATAIAVELLDTWEVHSRLIAE